ncbi:hypothetical protein WJX82_001265 [Trebouxia sp. C0006]
MTSDLQQTARIEPHRTLGQHIAGTSLMDEVFINQEANPYVLEVDGTLDLAGLQLQPGSIVINSKKGLVDVQTSKTKRIFADIQQKVLHDTTAGSTSNPLHISGAPIAGLDTGDSKLDQILSLLKAKTDPKARPISEVGSAEADSVLLDLGFLQDDGNEVCHTLEQIHNITRERFHLVVNIQPLLADAKGSP